MPSLRATSNSARAYRDAEARVLIDFSPVCRACTSKVQAIIYTTAWTPLSRGTGSARRCEHLVQAIELVLRGEVDFDRSSLTPANNPDFRPERETHAVLGGTSVHVLLGGCDGGTFFKSSRFWAPRGFRGREVLHQRLGFPDG